MTQAFRSTHPEDRVYARCMAKAPFIHASAQRATRDLARRDNLAREVSALARWEGEGGAVSDRSDHVAASWGPWSMRSAMSRRPAFDSPVRADPEALSAAPARKPDAAFPGNGARFRNKGPVKALRPDQNTSTHRMNNRRGIRSR